MNHEQAKGGLLLKQGVGQRVYLMFAGKRKISPPSELQLRPHGMQKFIPVLLLLVVGCMIGVVLWRQLSAMY